LNVGVCISFDIKLLYVKGNVQGKEEVRYVCHPKREKVHL